MVAINCSLVEVGIRNIGDYVLDPSSVCVSQEGSSNPPTCNTKAIPLENTAYVRVSVLVSTTANATTIHLTGGYLSVCQEDIRSASLTMAPCPSLSPSLSHSLSSSLSISATSFPSSQRTTNAVTSETHRPRSPIPSKHEPRRYGFCVGCKVN